MKAENDKYYTPIYLANYCWEKVRGKINLADITEIIEPSCGDGSFYHFERKPDCGYDIEPLCDFRNVIQADFLSQQLNYLKGRLIIGNPPYGKCMNMAQRFYRKAVEIADYIAFILPIGQLNNTHSLYQFDLIYSEDLGKHIYSGRELHCCLNIYKRPKSGKVNKKPKSTLKAITIIRDDQKEFANANYDIRMCYWGDGTAGKILKPDEHYAAEYKIIINDKANKEVIMDFFKKFDWKGYLKCIAMRKIQKFHIVDALANNIKGIE